MSNLPYNPRMVENAVHIGQDMQEGIIKPESRLIKVGNGIDLIRTHNLYSRGRNYEDQCFEHLAQNAPDGTLVIGPRLVDSIPQLKHKIKCDAITFDVSQDIWTLRIFHEFKVGNKGKTQTGRKIDGFERLIKQFRDKPYLLRDMIVDISCNEIPIPESILIPEDCKITLEFIFAVEENANQEKTASANLNMVWLPYEPLPAFIRSLQRNPQKLPSLY